MITRKQSRQKSTTVKVAASLAVCCCCVPTTAATRSDAFSPTGPFAAAIATDLPTNDDSYQKNNLPWWNRNYNNNDHDDDAGSSDREFETDDDDDDEYPRHTTINNGPTQTTSASPVTSILINSNTQETASGDDLNSSSSSSSYQSMKTLDKLQQMLDDTDHMIPRRHHPGHRSSRIPNQTPPPQHQQKNRLTRQDRSIYKKQQQQQQQRKRMRNFGMQNGSFEQLQQKQQKLNDDESRGNVPLPTTSISYPSNPTLRRPIHPFSSDKNNNNELSEEEDLPVYFSDAEGESETDSTAPDDTQWNTYSSSSSSYMIPNQERQYPRHSFDRNDHSSQHQQSSLGQQHLQTSAPYHSPPHNHPHPYHHEAQTGPHLQHYWENRVGDSSPGYPGNMQHSANQINLQSPSPQWSLPRDERKRLNPTSSLHPTFPVLAATHAFNAESVSIVSVRTTRTFSLDIVFARILIHSFLFIDD